MDYEEIKELALKLHSGEQRRLIATLAKSRSDSQKMNGDDMCREKMKRYLDYVVVLGNIEKDKVFSRTRIYPYPDVRTIIFYELHLQGFSSMQISRCTGYSHSNIIIKIKHMAEVIEDSRYDQLLYGLWETFHQHVQLTEIMNGKKEN